MMNLRGLLIGLGSILISVCSFANAATLPYQGTVKHSGLKTCKGSDCHGSPKKLKETNVGQNEYTIWKKNDQHANAYKVLLNDESKRIAKNLGIEKAHEAKLCLNCHADYVPKKRRGRRFKMSDGVSCEACHGSGRDYLGDHVEAPPRAQNIEQGMYPTDEPKARAELCLSCHLGNKDKFVDHRIMGAGHPRLVFELEKYTIDEPAHYVIDKDYRKRKSVNSSTTIWATGQATLTSQMMHNFTDSKLGANGLLPELVFFDCLACHHSMNDIRWEPRESTGLGPGVVRLNDANLLMLRHIAEELSAANGQLIKKETLALHAASKVSRQEMIAVAKRIARLADKLANSIPKKTFSSTNVANMLHALVKEGLSGQHRDYLTAEQASMAIQAIANTLKNTDSANRKAWRTFSDKVNNTLYAALKDEKKYQPAAYIQALKTLQSTMPK